VDDDLVGRAGDEDDDLQQVAGSIWADDQPPIRVFAEVINGKWVGDRVQDVIRRSRRDVGPTDGAPHVRIVLRNSCGCSTVRGAQNAPHRTRRTERHHSFPPQRAQIGASALGKRPMVCSLEPWHDVNARHHAL
jgi:hypothetical protein